MIHLHDGCAHGDAVPHLAEHELAVTLEKVAWVSCGFKGDGKAVVPDLELLCETMPVIQ